MYPLDQLEVVDVSLALDMMGGNELIYQKVIDSFISNQCNLVEDINENLETDKSEARRLVHSCKGIAINIGSPKLYDVATALEEAILDDMEALIEFYCNKFEDIFNKVIVELKMIRLKSTKG